MTEQNNRRKEERLEALLARVKETHNPPDGWERGVWDGVAQRQTRPSWREHWRLGAVIATGLVAFAIIAAWSASRKTEHASLEVAFARQPRAMRSIEARPGDEVSLRGRGGGRNRAIRLYLDDKVIASCPGSASCKTGDGNLTLVYPLHQTGYYKALFVHSAETVPTATEHYDRDVAEAAAAGAKFESMSFYVR